MKKFDAFSKCLNVLLTADKEKTFDDEEIWLEILKRRNIHDETSAVELVNLIFDKYISALVNLRDSLTERLRDAD